jgi:hypothetical protein
VGPIADLTLEGFISPDRRTSAYFGLTPTFWFSRIYGDDWRERDYIDEV